MEYHGMLQVKDTGSNAGRKVLKVFEKLKKKEVALVKSAPTSTSTDVGVEPTGTPEMMDMEKRDYGFDWPTSKGPDIDEYRPEG
jgi:hypothetical protein